MSISKTYMQETMQVVHTQEQEQNAGAHRLQLLLYPAPAI